MEDSNLLEEAKQLLEKSIVEYEGKPIGTLAAKDKSTKALNYNQIFIRDFAVSAFAFLFNDNHEIVKNFLEITLKLQSREEVMDCFLPAKGLMPASFKVSFKKGKSWFPITAKKLLQELLLWTRFFGGFIFCGRMLKKLMIGILHTAKNASLQ